MRKFLATVAVVTLLMVFAIPVLAGEDKVYVCHATSSESNPWVTLPVPPTDTGYPQGHFTENGTQEAGHEQDYLGYCEGDEPSASPSFSSSPSTSPQPTASPSPTVEPTSSPSAEPSSTPTPTITPEPSSTPQPTSSPSSSPQPSEVPSALPTLPPTDTE